MTDRQKGKQTDRQTDNMSPNSEGLQINIINVNEASAEKELYSFDGSYRFKMTMELERQHK